MSEKFPSFKTIYLYDKVSGIFIKEDKAQLSPLDVPGTYLFPTYYTEKKPPSCAVNEVAVFRSSGKPNEGSWLVKKDYRGVTVFNQKDNSTKTITEVGNLPQDYALTKAIKFQIEEQAKQTSITINNRRKIESLKDVSTVVGNKVYCWQVDYESLHLIDSTIARVAFGIIECPETWRSSGNKDVKITVENLKDISAAAANQMQEAFKRSCILKNKLSVAIKNKDLDAIKNITW